MEAPVQGRVHGAARGLRRRQLVLGAVEARALGGDLQGVAGCLLRSMINGWVCLLLPAEQSMPQVLSCVLRGPQSHAGTAWARAEAGEHYFRR